MGAGDVAQAKLSAKLSMICAGNTKILDYAYTNHYLMPVYNPSLYSKLF